MKNPPLFLSVVGMLCLAPCQAAISFVAGAAGVNEVNIADPYVQDFNTLAQAGTGIAWTNDATLAGWHADKATYSVTTGSATGTGAMYSYGSSAQGSVLGDRSLGGQANTTTGVTVGLQLVNASGATIDAVSISFFLEQWNASATPNSPVTFSYQVFAGGTGSLTGGTYLPVAGLSATPNLVQGTKPDGSTGTGAIIGNLHSTALDDSLGGLNWTDGSELWLKWSFAKTSGPNTHFGLDDLTVSVVPEPAAAVLGSLGLLLLFRRRRA